MSLRDLCREMIVSPLSLYRWRDDGLPIVRYYPWVLFDRERVGQWLAGARPDSVQQVSADDLRRPLLTVLQAVAEGVATAEDGADLYGWLETAHFLGPRDPVWTPLWSASVEQERRDNAAQYGLTEPTDSWLGIPPDEARGNVFEIRDLSRRVGASPIDVVRWTHEGMACLRSSPLVRWDIRRVTEWLSEGGFLPDRRTIKELDVTERFVFEAVAAGDATPSEAHEALSGWIGVM